jgi:hypothetical protein
MLKIWGGSFNPPLLKKIKDFTVSLLFSIQEKKIIVAAFWVFFFFSRRGSVVWGFWWYLGTESGAFHMLGKCSTTELHLRGSAFSLGLPGTHTCLLPHSAYQQACITMPAVFCFSYYGKKT